LVKLDVNSEVYSQLIASVENKEQDAGLSTGEEKLTVFLPTCNMYELFVENSIFQYVSIVSIDIDASKNWKKEGDQKEILVSPGFSIFTNKATWIIERYRKQLLNISCSQIVAIIKALKTRKFHTIFVKHLIVQTDAGNRFEFQAKNVSSRGKLKVFLDEGFEKRSKHRVLDLTIHDPDLLLDLYNSIPTVYVRRCQMQKKLNVETAAHCLTLFGSEAVLEAESKQSGGFESTPEKSEVEEIKDETKEPFGEELDDPTRINPYKEEGRIIKKLKAAGRENANTSSLGKYKKEE
jgi:hypothetical protein